MKIEIKELSFNDIVAFVSDVITVSSFLEVDVRKSRYAEYKTGEKYLGPKDEVCFEDVIASILLDNQPVYIKDLEDDEKYVLTLEKMKTGLSLLFDNEQESFISIIDETYDYEDMNKWLQFALFNEIVWG